MSSIYKDLAEKEKADLKRAINARKANSVAERQDVSCEALQTTFIDKLPLDNIFKKNYDCIVGISRGGTVPATIMSFIMNTPVHFITWSYDKRIEMGLNQGEYKDQLKEFPDLSSYRRILLVDNIMETGNTMDEVISAINFSFAIKEIKNMSIDTLALHWRKGAIFKPTYTLNVINQEQRIKYPWEI